MKVKALVVLVMALAATARAEQKLDVFVKNGERIPFETLQHAEALASRIFASADVRIAWHGVARSGGKGQSRVILMQLEMDTTPMAYHASALGYSLPFEGVHVSIFYGRIRQMDQPYFESVLLGYAMVHEITHLLQGTDHHSTTGVMKAQWDSGDYLEMKRHILALTPEDIQLIRNAADHHSRPPAVTPAKIP
jgi:hypothetical protein